jgi:hypothetical protein
MSDERRNEGGGAVIAIVLVLGIFLLLGVLVVFGGAFLFLARESPGNMQIQMPPVSKVAPAPVDSAEPSAVGLEEVAPTVKTEAEVK